jgi:hypothetical protein
LIGTPAHDVVEELEAGVSFAFEEGHAKCGVVPRGGEDVGGGEEIPEIAPTGLGLGDGDDDFPTNAFR